MGKWIETEELRRQLTIERNNLALAQKKHRWTDVMAVITKIKQIEEELRFRIPRGGIASYIADADRNDVSWKMIIATALVDLAIWAVMDFQGEMQKHGIEAVDYFDDAKRGLKLLQRFIKNIVDDHPQGKAGFSEEYANATEEMVEWVKIYLPNKAREIIRKYIEIELR